MPTAMRSLESSAPGFAADLERVLHWSAETDRAIEERVEAILADVRTRGDAAVLEYTQRFDGVTANAVADLEIGRDELAAALQSIPAAQRQALEDAARRVRTFHERQLEGSGRS